MRKKNVVVGVKVVGEDRVERLACLVRCVRRRRTGEVVDIVVVKVEWKKDLLDIG